MSPLCRYQVPALHLEATLFHEHSVASSALPCSHLSRVSPPAVGKYPNTPFFKGLLNSECLATSIAIRDTALVRPHFQVSVYPAS